MAAGTELLERDMVKISQRQLSKTTDPIEKLRLECLSRGVSGIKRIGRLFRIVDDDRDTKISLTQLAKVVHDFEVVMTDEELQVAFDKFEKDESGSIDYEDFLKAVVPPISNSRVAVIKLAFDKFDQNGDGVITIADMKGKYNARHHPKYENGEWTTDQVFEKFLANFDSPTDPDHIVTQSEFYDYYYGLSASIDSDSFFDVMLRKAWKL